MDLNKLIEDRIAAIIDPLISSAVAKYLGAALPRDGKKVPKKAAKKAPTYIHPKSCKWPGCKKPNKGPRYWFLCDTHRDKPAAERKRVLAKQTAAPSR